MTETTNGPRRIRAKEAAAEWRWEYLDALQDVAHVPSVPKASTRGRTRRNERNVMTDTRRVTPDMWARLVESALALSEITLRTRARMVALDLTDEKIDDEWMRWNLQTNDAALAFRQLSAIYQVRAAFVDGLKRGVALAGNRTEAVCGVNADAPLSKPPCTVCGLPHEKHGSYPTCASHPYTPDDNCQHVPGARCVGAECKAGCVRASTKGLR